MIQQSNGVNDDQTTYFNMLKLHNTKVDKIIKGF